MLHNNLENLNNIYVYMQGLQKLYSLLQDELSRRIFWARLQADAELEYPGKTELSGIKELATIFNDQGSEKVIQASDILQAAIRNHERIIVYGTRMTGLQTALKMIVSNIDFCFVSRGSERFPSGLMGKPVYSPDWLAEHSKDAIIIIAATNTYGCYDEIVSILKDFDIPQDHFISHDRAFYQKNGREQYFEFPELIPKGKAFADCGCFDGGTSSSFARCCEKDYSKIFAFEPDPVSFERCKRTFQNAGLHGVELSNHGVSSQTSVVKFLANASGNSFIFQEDGALAVRGQKSIDDVLGQGEKFQTIQTISIDDVIGTNSVGFIKMDIEGFELSALQGAKNTLLRDKPFLAICVYHKAGDMLAIMDYLNQVVPEYKFWLRQYDVMNETVLYAPVK